MDLRGRTAEDANKEAIGAVAPLAVLGAAGIGGGLAASAAADATTLAAPSVPTLASYAWWPYGDSNLYWDGGIFSSSKDKVKGILTGEKPVEKTPPRTEPLYDKENRRWTNSKGQVLPSNRYYYHASNKEKPYIRYNSDGSITRSTAVEIATGLYENDGVDIAANNAVVVTIQRWVSYWHS